MRRALFLVLLTACSGSSDEPATTPAEDSSTPDTATVDTGTPDSVVVDSAVDTAPETFDAAPVAFSEKLSAMDLYSDIVKKTVHPKNLAYAPTYELWSDGAAKSRWITLPPGQKIDNTDMDHWAFPNGTRLWKEFAKDGKRLETRMIEKTGDDAWRYGSYVWNDAETEATWTTGGATSVRGTTHDVPKEADCQRCHDGGPAKILGFASFQLDKGTPLSLMALSDKLKVAPVAGTNYGPPGTDVERKALGYLAGNCGNCHNPNNTLVFIAAGMDLHSYAAERDVKTTQAYLTTVNKATEKYVTIPYRIKGSDSANSAVYVRMNKRDKDAMPPIGSKDVHTAGLATIKAWIDIVPKP